MIAHFISSLAHGGAEQVLITLVQELQKRGYCQAVLYIHDGPHRATLAQLGIATYQMKGVFFRYDPFFLLRVIVCLWKLKPHLLHTSLWMANLAGRIAARALRLPIVHAYHNHASLDGAFRNRIDGISGARYIPGIAASDQTAQSLQIKGIDPKHISVVLNAVAQLPKKAESWPFSDNTKSNFIIGMVARMHPVKNHKTLLLALRILAEQNVACIAVLVTDGQVPELVALIQQLQLQEKVQWVIGKASQDYIPYFNCLILPSLSEGGIPLVIQEAMVLEIPCIVSQQANVAGIIEHERSGLLFDAPDFKALASCIKHLALHPEQALYMGRNGRQSLARVCCPDRMINGYLAVFEKLMCI